MAAVSNVTIETWVCADGIDDEAVAIAQRLIANTAKK